MLSQSLVLFLRNLLKDKIFTLINITNLVVGFATFILISQFIEMELNWDIHNVNYKRIYRVQLFHGSTGKCSTAFLKCNGCL